MDGGRRMNAVSVGCGLPPDFQGVQAMIWRVLTRFRAIISPTAGGGALGFLLSFSMPEAWRAVAGAVAEGTAPVKTTEDSLLQRPAATWC